MQLSSLPNFSEDNVGVQGGLEVGKCFKVSFLLHAHMHHLLGLRLGGLLRTHFNKVIQSFHLVECFSLKKGRDGTGLTNRKFLEKVEKLLKSTVKRKPWLYLLTSRQLLTISHIATKQI